MDWGNIEILDSANNDYKVELKEIMHINKLKPDLNVHTHTYIHTLIFNSNN